MGSNFCISPGVSWNQTPILLNGGNGAIIGLVPRRGLELSQLRKSLVRNLWGISVQKHRQRNKFNRILAGPDRCTNTGRPLTNQQLECFMAAINLKAALAASCIFLSACGGGGGDESEDTKQAASVPCVPAGAKVSFDNPTPPPADALAVSWTPVDFSIDLFGDSTNWLAYPYWRAMFGDMVVDRAAKGAKTDTALTGKDGVNQPWPKSVGAQVIVLNYGMNDGASAMPIATYKANLRKMADVHARVVFETPNPSTHYDVAPYAQAMREVAAESRADVIDTYACMLKRSDWYNLLYDGTHPTPEGLQYIVETCVAPVITQLGCTPQQGM